MSFEYKQDEVGSIFIGTKIYDKAKFAEALKMFDNVVPVLTVSTTTNILSNTNANSIAVRRGNS